MNGRLFGTVLSYGTRQRSWIPRIQGSQRTAHRAATLLYRGKARMDDALAVMPFQNRKLILGQALVGAV